VATELAGGKRGRKRGSSPPSGPLGAPLSEPRSAGCGPGCLVPFFLLFAIAGGAFFGLAFARPLWKTVVAQSWPEVPCQILSSRVAESPGSDGATYRVEIAYTYQVGGIRHPGDRYDFLGGSSSGYEGKNRIVERYPEGSRAVCYVNPADPTEAVLSRRFSPAYLMALLPLLFVGIGVAGAVWALRGRRAGPAVALSPFGVPAAAEAGPVRLSPAISPGAKLAGLTAVALFWNGLVSVFVWQAVAGYRRGQADGCLTLFLVPFVLVGVGLAVAVVRQFLALWNPRPLLTLSRGTLPLGEPVLLQWRFTGRTSRIARLILTLEGREEATYRRGTDTVTDRETFAVLPVLDTPFGERISSGTASVSAPAGGVPSFAAQHNKVIWALKVKAEIPGWPDVDEEYPVVVVPAVGGSF